MIELIFTKIEEINRLIVFRKIMHQSFELSDNDDGRKIRKEQDQSQRYLYQLFTLSDLVYLLLDTVIFLHAHPACFTHSFVSGMQSFHFKEFEDAMS